MFSIKNYPFLHYVYLLTITKCFKAFVPKTLKAFRRNIILFHFMMNNTTSMAVRIFMSKQSKQQGF